MSKKCLKIKFEDSIKFENGSMIQTFGVSTKNIRSKRGEEQLDRLSTMFTEEIICPYCGYVEGDSWEYDQKDEEYECGECGEISNLTVEFIVEYSTSKKED